MKDRLSHRGCGTGTDQSLCWLLKVNRAGQCPDSALALLTARQKNGNGPGSEVTERRIIASVTAGVSDGAEGAARSKKKVEKAAWEGSRPEVHAMRLLRVKLFSHRQGLHSTSIMFALKNDKLFKSGAV